MLDEVRLGYVVFSCVVLCLYFIALHCTTNPFPSVAGQTLPSAAISSGAARSIQDRENPLLVLKAATLLLLLSRARSSESQTEFEFECVPPDASFLFTFSGNRVSKPPFAAKVTVDASSLTSALASTRCARELPSEGGMIRLETLIELKFLN